MSSNVHGDAVTKEDELSSSMIIDVRPDAGTRKLVPYFIHYCLLHCTRYVTLTPDTALYCYHVIAVRRQLRLAQRTTVDTCLLFGGKKFMSLRNMKVSELDTWTDGSLTSTRQADGSNCELFVLVSTSRG